MCHKSTGVSEDGEDGEVNGLSKVQTFLFTCWMNFLPALLRSAELSGRFVYCIFAPYVGGVCGYGACCWRAVI